MQIDLFIDEMLRLQTRHAGLIWRMWEDDGVYIEFYLEELALDCFASLQKAGIAARYNTETARLLHVPVESIETDLQKIVITLQTFLKNNTGFIYSHSFEKEP